MKQVLNILFVFTFYFMTCQVRAQSTVSKDSILVHQMHQLKGFLSLSDAQEQSWLILERQQQKTMDSVTQLHLSLEDRNKWLTGNIQKHSHQVKSILSEDQWKKYTAMLESRRQEFLKHAADKNIKVTEIQKGN